MSRRGHSGAGCQRHQVEGTLQAGEVVGVPREERYVVPHRSGGDLQVHPPRTGVADMLADQGG